MYNRLGEKAEWELLDEGRAHSALRLLRRKDNMTARHRMQLAMMLVLLSLQHMAQTYTQQYVFWLMVLIIGLLFIWD